MGNFALVWLGIMVLAFLVWGVAMIAIGTIYDVYLFFKYSYKGMRWLWRKFKH